MAAVSQGTRGLLPDRRQQEGVKPADPTALAHRAEPVLGFSQED